MKRRNEVATCSSDDDDNEPKYCNIVPLISHEFMNVSNNLTGDRESIIKSLETASQMAVKKINELAISMDSLNVRKLLTTFLAKQLSPKIYGPDPQSFTEILFDAVVATVSDYDQKNIYIPTTNDSDEDASDSEEDAFDLIGIIKLPSGSLRDSFYVEGVACRKDTLNHGDYEFISLSVENPKMLMLNVKLDPRSRHSDPYQSKADRYIYDMLDKYVNHGVNAVLSCQAIGDLAKQYFAEKGVNCAGLFDKVDLDRVASATGTFVTSYCSFTPIVLKEDKFGNEVFRVFTGCSRRKTATLVLRGSDQCIKEVESDIDGLIESLRSFVKDNTAVIAGPTLYRKISRYVSKEAHNVAKDSQPFIKDFAKAFKAVSHQIIGIGAPGPDVLNNPSQKHGIVYEPTSRHINAIHTATLMARFHIRYPTARQIQA